MNRPPIVNLYKLEFVNPEIRFKEIFIGSLNDPFALPNNPEYLREELERIEFLLFVLSVKEMPLDIWNTTLNHGEGGWFELHPNHIRVYIDTMEWGITTPIREKLGIDNIASREGLRKALRFCKKVVKRKLKNIINSQKNYPLLKFVYETEKLAKKGNKRAKKLVELMQFPENIEERYELASELKRRIKRS